MTSKGVSIAFESESEYAFDVINAKPFTDLMVSAKISKQVEVKFKTSATAKKIFSGQTPLIETLCEGMKMNLSMDFWKEFYLTQLFMFAEKALVPI